MAVSHNENVKVGNAVFHVQTEYYKKTGKVVSNIFKDGLSIKRLEREVEEGVDIDSAVSDFHRYVVERLKGTVKSKRTPREKEAFTLSEQLEKELLTVIYPYFGVASSFVLEEALSESSNSDEFLDHLLDGLPDDLKGTLKERIVSIISSCSTNESENLEKTEPEDNTSFEKFDEEKRKKILDVLSEFFGIMALPILEEALEEWDGDYHHFVEIIVSHLEDEKEREELYKRLMFL